MLFLVIIMIIIIFAITLIFNADKTNNNTRENSGVAALDYRNHNHPQSTKYESPCTRKWNRGELFLHCVECSSAENKLTICKECYDNSEHSRHETKIVISGFNGSCKCGDISAMKADTFCSQHRDCNQHLITYKITYNNSKEVRKISTLLNVTEVEAKELAKLNKLESVCELSDEGNIIKDYFRNTQAHANMEIYLINVYAVNRIGRERNFRRLKFSNDRRLLLWHGTKRANLSGIFGTSLKLPISPRKEYMFGKGIYFADRVTKSANYTDCGHLYRRGDTGVLLLCEVAVGNMCIEEIAQTHLTKPRDNYQSVKGLGKFQPSVTTTETIIMRNDTIVPSGKTVLIDQNLYLDFNEYVVYDPKRVLIKFIVEFVRI